MAKTIIFTDGSSRGNPGPGGWGAIVAYVEGKERKIRELGGAEKSTTNNRMEMMAVIEGLAFARLLTSECSDGGQVKKNIPESEIVLYTDSEYVKKGATEWAYGWASNGWKTKANMPVLNKDLWQKIIELMNDLEIEFNVIVGHVGIPANERCDEIATTFADGRPTKLFYGDMKTYHVSLEIKSRGAGEKNKIASRPFNKKAYSYVSAIKGVAKVHKSWAECEARVKGQPNARYRKAMNREEETNLIKEFSPR